MKKIVAFIAVLIYMTCAGTVWGQTLSNPQDVTWRITNPNFDSNADGWNGSPSWYQKCVEKWNAGSVDVYQELTGLPAGLYSVSVDGLYRPGHSETTSLDRHAVLYANESSTPLWHINVSRETEKLETDDKTITVDEQTYYVPFNRLGASRYFEKGVYTDNRVWVIVSEDGNLRIGIKKDVAVTNDWICFDNFQLTYYGNPTLYTASTGTYYLQNVATGEYLQGGMSYGTKAVLGNGIEFSLERQSNGTYRIGSDIMNNGHDYLCDEASIDHIETDFLIAETSEGSGIYTISTTTDGCINEGQADGQSGRLLTAKDATFSIDLKYVHFNIWDSPLPGASCTTVNGPCTNYNLNGDPLFYGDGNVGYLHYADISEYQSLTIKGTGGGTLRVLLNRTKDGGTVAEGALTEKLLDMSSGSATLDLTQFPYAHLHAIKVGTGTVTVTEATLQKKQQAVTFESGKKSTDAYSQWRFVTEQDRLADLASATPSRPKDATFLIKGASFTAGDERGSRWTGNGFEVARGWNRPDDGAAGIVNSKGGIDVSQQLNNLPNGTYIITMQGGHKNGTNAQFYANDESVSLAAVATDVTSVASASLSTYYTTNYQQTLKVKVTNGSLKLGVRGDTPSNTGDNLLFFDNFRLTYLGNVEEKTYYMRNVATGDFLRAGGRFEAQAIRDDWGLAMNFIIKSGGTICSIDSRISNGGDNQYLGIANDFLGFLDSPETEFILENLGGEDPNRPKYAIRTTDGKYLATSDGDNYVNFDRGIQSSDTHAQWELLTKQDLIDELSGASDSNPKDATFLIEGSNLGRHDLRNNDTNWKGIDFSSNEYGGVESLDWSSQDNYANSVIEKFNKNFDTYQTISGLPAGVYELTVQGYYRSGNTATAAGKTNDGTDILRPILYVKQEGKLIGQAPLQSIFDGGVSNQTDGFSTSVNGEWLPNSLSDAAKTFRDDHYMPSGECNKVRFVVPSDGATVQIGVKKNIHYDSDWTVFDNFRLTYLGSPQNGESQTVYSYELGETWGTFYLKNAQTGTYLTAGGTDGVSAVLGDQMHQHSVYNNEAKYQKGVRETDFTFVAVGADKFVIETGIGEGYLTLKGKLNGKNEIHIVKKVTAGNNIGDNEYVVYDPTPKVQDDKTQTRFLKNGGYGTVSDENPATNGNIRWIFQTKANLLAEFPSATESNPIDATFLLRGTAFHKDDNRNSAWTGKPVVGGAESNYVGSASGRTFDISQKLTGVPNGVYEFTLQGYYITEGDALNTDVKYYTSTDGRTLTTTNYNGVPAVVNGKNFTSDGQNSLVWSENFQSNMDGSFSYTNSFTTADGSTVKNVQIGSRPINQNFGLPEYQVTYQTDGTTVKSKTEWQYHNNGLYAASSGTRVVGFSNLQAGQIVKLKVDDISAFSAADNLLEKDLIRSVDGEVVFRVIKSGNAGVYVTRYHHIYEVSVHNELTSSSVSISTPNDASTVFASGQGTHPVIRFKVENKTIIAGVYNTIKTDNASLYIDNVRLTYLGENVTDGIATPQKIARGIRHKRSRYYDLAAENGHLEFDGYNTVKEGTNKTTLSNKTMVAHEHIAGRMIQHAPVYRDTIYARAGETLNIVLPSSYTDLAQSSGKYYQRLYNYKTDDMFVEDAGKFDLGGSDQGTTYTDADIRKAMEVYEGSMSAPAGGWVFGNRWGQQLVSRFNFTTPTDRGKFKKAKDHAIEIAIDYTDLPDVGDMGMFGDLTEPTLVQRAIFVIVPSDEMVKNLSASTGDKFLEVKSISFPSIWHGLNTNDLNAVALDKQVRNYFTGVHNDVNLDSLVITLTNNGTGITLENGTYEGKFSKSTDRFIKFKYPSNNEVTNCVTEYIYVRTKDNENIAKFILDFVPNTELRPWKDIMGQATLSRSPMYLDNHAQLIDVLNFDKSYRKDGEAVYHPSTWPIGDDTSVNGIERDTVVKNPSQFNPYPLDFDQTTFGAYYPRAIWSQYSVMKRLHSYRDKPEFKDVNQLYHDYFNTKKGTSGTKEGIDKLLQKYQGGGYFMYIDASNFPSSIARLTMEEKLCAGTTIHFSGWVSSMDLSTDGGNDPGYLLFSIVGIDARGNETVIESFCPGPIRADGKSYAGNTVKYDTYHTEIGWTDSYSIWQQFAFSFVVKADVASKYEEYALKIDNYCSSTSGGDMMVDDVRLYIHKAVPEVMQETPICEVGRMNNMKVSAKFDELVSSVNKSRENVESAAYEKYTTASGNQKFIPSAWYCFLDKQTYDRVLKSDNTANREKNAFNAALVTQGGNYGTGFYKFDFSTRFESNDKGKDSRTNGSAPYKYEYDALAEEVINPNGEVAEERVYLNPIESQLLAGETSLRDMAYYLKSGDKWITATPGWEINKETTTVYGDGIDIAANRYTDVSGYEELRIYQTTPTNIRCFFINKEGVETVSSAPNNETYHAINLTEIKNTCGGKARLICIKGPDGSTPITASDITLYKSSAVLVPDKKYYIVFHATADGSIPDLSKPDEFFMMNSEINKTCAAIDSFSLASGSIIRINGSLSSDNSSYCAGQIATLKVELQGVNKNRAVMQEDRFYDWWLGDKESLKTANNGEGLYAYQVLENFRAAYPEEEYDNQDPIDGVFTEADKTYLKELITPQINNEGEYEPARLYLYQSSLNVRVTDKDSDGQMHITVIPVDAQLAEANYCDPIQVSMVVSGKAPTAKDGFEGISYLGYLNEVPLRIGLEQVKSVTDGAKDSWGSDDKVLYVPLRDIAFSGTTGFSNGFKKVNHKDMEIAAVFLAETNDPEMISYDVNQEGDKEMRYVGKVRTFAAATGRYKFEDYVKLTFNPGFTPKEGYRYTLKTSFVETNAAGTASTCHGDLLIPLYIVPEYQVWVGGPDGNWANDDNWRRADNGELKFATTDRPTNKANTTSQGFVPMDFTKVLMKSDSVAVLKSVTKDGDLVKFSDTDGHTPDIQYHLAAKNDAPWVSSMRETDIYCEPFYTNTAKEVHFEPYSQMLNTQYLTYERAWVEYELESGRWYTLSSPLQGVVSGDMYLPRGTAKQETPYFDPITYNNTDYTRLAPAVYQQAWDKAEATLYRLERDQLDNYRLPDWERNTATANVAQALDWSYEYNDVKVPFGVNGFSVKVDMSRIKDYSKKEGVKDVLLRLPKDDKTYRYYMYDDDHNGSQTVDLTTTLVNGKNLRENAGKLFTDGMPTGSMTVTLTNNSTNNPYFLVGNPFMSGLDLDKFFAENTGLENKYWILTKDSYSAGIKDGEEQWASTDEFTTGKVAPLQAFFVKKSAGTGGTLNVKFTSGMAVQLAEDALQTRAGGAPATLRLTAMRDGVESRAIVVCREEATEGFSAGEDVEALFDSNLSHAPTLYTAAGEVAAAINVRRTLHGVPVGIGGEDETEVTLTFDGVEQFGEELYLYDAAEGTSTLIPASGTSLSVCGRTTGRYYLVTTPLDGSAQESVPVVSVQGRVVTVLSAFDEILSIEAFDAMGCRVYADGAVGNRTRFALPAQGVYLITVKTAAGVFCHKVLVNS